MTMVSGEHSVEVSSSVLLTPDNPDWFSTSGLIDVSYNRVVTLPVLDGRRGRHFFEGSVDNLFLAIAEQAGVVPEPEITRARLLVTAALPGFSALMISQEDRAELQAWANGQSREPDMWPLCARVVDESLDVFGDMEGEIAIRYEEHLPKLARYITRLEHEGTFYAA